MAVRSSRALGMAILLGGLLATPATAPAEEPVCFECHDAFPDFAVQHPPFEEGDCTGCHVDHGDEERLMLVAEGADLCLECHDAFAGATVHSPVADGECTTCHSPHGSANRAMLVADGAALCEECHDAFAGATVHPPVAEGECTSCHSPHASDNEQMLVAAGADLCLECHDAFTGGGSEHAPVKEGRCTSCHNPHSSPNAGMLAAPGAGLCAKCHAESATLKGKVEHAALDEGCDSCHRPHASEQPRLLVQELRLDRIALYDSKDAALCYECHDEASLLEDESEDTGFRNGVRNLHSLHLNGGAVKNKYGMIKKKDGQTCFACHEPHAAHQERLLRTQYECLGTACFTMRFIPNEHGATCVVGCHKPKTYSRNGQIAGAAAGSPKAK